MDAPVKVRQHRKSSKQASKTPVSDAETAIDKHDPAYLKRREQVRRAQRTHRERKENYIKALEGEVHQLRSETLTLNAEVSLLRGVIRQLDLSPVREHHQKTRLDIGTSLPLLSPSGADSSFPLNQDASPHELDGVRALNRFQGSITDGCCPPPEPSIDTYSQYFTDPDAVPLPDSALTLSLGAADQASLGLEFVLTLESPCKQHHVQIAVALSGDQTVNDIDIGGNDGPATQVPWSLPADEEASNTGLENLLALANNLSLTSEITPIQAWYEIRSHPDFQLLDVPRLKQLAEDLLIYVRCYGFGAVIETDVFKRLYNELWPREC